MLSDFGVSRVLVASHVTTCTTSFKGTTRWMAVEFFPQANGTFSGKPATANEQTDVWAFGMTVYVSSHLFLFGYFVTVIM